MVQAHVMSRLDELPGPPCLPQQCRLDSPGAGIRVASPLDLEEEPSSSRGDGIWDADWTSPRVTATARSPRGELSSERALSRTCN
mmetsp:Transcript_2614/g.6589  ORF Transcript_2614/g.6589 Transcript_2614/m.6589 type:complete len:85 (+) Transcript_2614:640-894(+)